MVDVMRILRIADEMRAMFFPSRTAFSESRYPRLARFWWISRHMLSLSLAVFLLVWLLKILPSSYWGPDPIRGRCVGVSCVQIVRRADHADFRADSLPG
jgi:hypothetical protein